MTDIAECSRKGFTPVLQSDTWQIATIQYDTQYSKAGFDHMKRHMTTDEVFILMRGEAVLHTVEDGKLESIHVDAGKIYCVRKGTWHYLEVSQDAQLAVAENNNLLPEDTERKELACLLQK